MTHEQTRVREREGEREGGREGEGERIKRSSYERVAELSFIASSITRILIEFITKGVKIVERTNMKEKQKFPSIITMSANFLMKIFGVVIFRSFSSNNYLRAFSLSFLCFLLMIRYQRE